MGELQLVPVTFADACQFVADWHRHHQPPRGHKYSIGVASGSTLVGVAIVGRPVARHYDDGQTLEVTRVATDGTAHANSMLYAAAWRGCVGSRLPTVDHLHAGQRVGFIAARRRVADRRRASTTAGMDMPVTATRVARHRQRAALPVGGQPWVT